MTQLECYNVCDNRLPRCLCWRFQSEVLYPGGGTHPGGSYTTILQAPAIRISLGPRARKAHPTHPRCSYTDILQGSYGCFELRAGQAPPTHPGGSYTDIFPRGSYTDISGCGQGKRFLLIQVPAIRIFFEEAAIRILRGTGRASGSYSSRGQLYGYFPGGSYTDISAYGQGKCLLLIQGEAIRIFRATGRESGSYPSRGQLCGYFSKRQL